MPNKEIGDARSRQTQRHRWHKAMLTRAAVCGGRGLTVAARRGRAGQGIVRERIAHQCFADLFELLLRGLDMLLIHACAERHDQSTKQQPDDQQHDGEFEQAEAALI